MDYDIYENQCAKFRKLVTLLPPDARIQHGEEMMRFIVGILVWPDMHASQGPAHMSRPLLDSDQEILYHHLRVLIIDHGLDPNIGYVRMHNISLIQWAASIPSSRQAGQTTATADVPRLSFLSRDQRRGRAIKMCGFLLAHGADPRLPLVGQGLPMRHKHFLDSIIEIGEPALPVLETVLAKWPVHTNPDFYTQYYNRRGDNPLHAACRLPISPLGIVKALLKHGFDSTQKNRWGETALQIAYSTPKPSVRHHILLGLALHGVALSHARTDPTSFADCSQSVPATPPGARRTERAMAVYWARTAPPTARMPTTGEWVTMRRKSV